MMWVFAVLVVLAMAGVALLAAGHGGPMAPVYDDRPDALVPADGPLDAGHLRRVRFSLALRGYRMSEVDALLARLTAQLEQQERAALRETAPTATPVVGAVADGARAADAADAPYVDARAAGRTVPGEQSPGE